MSQVVKGARLIATPCRLLPRYASTAAAPVAHKQTHEQSDEHWRDSRFLFGAALVGTLGTAFAGGLIASAKEGNEIEGSLEEQLSLDTTEDAGDVDQRIKQWKAVQERYLLVAEAKRDAIEIRDITAEEFAEADAMYHNNKMTDLEDKLVELNTVSPENCQVLWRLARLKWVMGRGYQANRQHKVFHVAHAMACRAAEVNPESADAHRWIAILSYYRAEKEGRPASVLNLEGMKYHIDRAVEINPEDSIAWNLLGMWHFECAELTLRQRVWSKLMARCDPPAGSYNKALECFERSHNIKPWIQNTYHIAITHLRMRHKEQAVALFEKLSEVKIVTHEDFRVRKESFMYVQKLTNPKLTDRLKDKIIDGYLDSYRIDFHDHRDVTNNYNRYSLWNDFWGIDGV